VTLCANNYKNKHEQCDYRRQISDILYADQNKTASIINRLLTDVKGATARDVTGTA